MVVQVKRNPTSKSETGPVQEFLSCLAVMERATARVEKLPRRALLEQLSATNSPTPKAMDLVRHITTLSRQFDHIRETLQSQQAVRNAEAAVRQSDRHLRDLLEARGLMNPTEFASRLCWSRQALSKALQARRVFFVELNGSRYYPAFFADPNYERRHLEALCKLLGDLPGGAKLQFMFAPKGSLDGLTPLEALAKGQIAAAKSAATGFAQR